MDWDMTESSSSSSKAEEGTGTTYHYTADYFLKRDKNVQESKTRKRREERIRKPIAPDDDDEDWETVTRLGKQMTIQDRTKMLFGKDVEVGHDVIKRKRDEFMMNRGKRLQGEKTVADFIYRVQLYVERKFENSCLDLLCRIYIRTIEHAYYKSDTTCTWQQWPWQFSVYTTHRPTETLHFSVE
ncbi:eukaryotic translation initiation factor 3 subunit C-like [Halichondria panicea]|uniref:eukaryotic translation initiation factor 3 subunit C-like n=1 Tax=Halichondria panicea TaxID=6063 RepID=UPI00312B7A3F